VKVEPLPPLWKRAFFYMYRVITRKNAKVSPEEEEEEEDGKKKGGGGGEGGQEGVGEESREKAVNAPQEVVSSGNRGGGVNKQIGGGGAATAVLTKQKSVKKDLGKTSDGDAGKEEDENDLDDEDKARKERRRIRKEKMMKLLVKIKKSVICHNEYRERLRLQEKQVKEFRAEEKKRKEEENAKWFEDPSHTLFEKNEMRVNGPNRHLSVFKIYIFHPTPTHHVAFFLFFLSFLRLQNTSSVGSRGPPHQQ
jgi:hypothetical protein